MRTPETDGKIDAGTLLEFVCVRLAGLGGGADVLGLATDGLGIHVMPLWERRRPCTVVVLDNASAHMARRSRGAAVSWRSTRTTRSVPRPAPTPAVGPSTRP
ncbi:hypothetical protein AB5L52_39030 [Streptomyces sp. CG4]|uniref:hypothetical protein n=1 Tax=Streptomyces sp. CG4 TaxID=408783 RepID=UPI0034E2E856